MPNGLSPRSELPAAVLHQPRNGEELETHGNLRASDKDIFVAERFSLDRNLAVDA